MIKNKPVLVSDIWSVSKMPIPKKFEDAVFTCIEGKNKILPLKQ